MTRRKRVDGVDGEAEIMSGAFAGVMPPDNIELSPEEMEIWKDLVSTKAARSWTKSDLYMLADLAAIHVRANLLRVKLRKPTASLAAEKRLDMLVKRARLLNAHLQVHCDATQGKSREQVAQNQQHQDSIQTAMQFEDDDLLARPH